MGCSPIGEQKRARIRLFSILHYEAERMSLEEDCSKSHSINQLFSKTLCTICYEDLKPIVEDLQCISICGHVFHELCLQQLLEHCPAGKKRSCPVCKQACSVKNIIRLYFQSICESTQSNPSLRPSDSADTHALNNEVKKLEGKLMGLSSAYDYQQQLLTELTVELSQSKELAKKEEAQKEEAFIENARIRQLLQLKTQELNRSSAESTKLQERSLALVKELATLKLVSDTTLDEEEVMKLASIGDGANSSDMADVLKKSLLLRNKQYKELMAQCDLLGRGGARSLRKLEKAKEKMKRLKTKLLEVERILEEKDNEVLRALKDSKVTITKEGIDLSGKQNSSSRSVEQMGKSVEPMFNRCQTSSMADHFFHVKKIANAPAFHNDVGVGISKGNNDVIDLDMETDSLSFAEDATELYPVPRLPIQANIWGHAATPQSPSVTFGEACVHGKSSFRCLDSRTGSENERENKLDRAVDECVMYIGDQTSAAKMLIPDVILGDTSLLPVKKEALEGSESITCPGNQYFPGGFFGPEGVNRQVGKSCKRTQGRVSASVFTGDLIAVKADGRAGTVKVLRAHNHVVDGGGTSSLPKKCKYGDKRGGQSHGCLQLEHIFIKKECP